MGMSAESADPAAGDSPPSRLAVLRLAEERAAAGYLAARKAMKHAAARGVGVVHLAAQHPTRADYQRAAARACAVFRAAERRTGLAYTAWQRAIHRYDTEWMATEGRATRLAVA